MLVPEGEAMVEIKYDESKNHLRLPKNIRQIGRPDNRIKIYVEDYAVTYLNQIAQETPQEERLAILLGDIVLDEDTAVVFVSGAVAARQVNIQDEHIGFTSSIWSSIYDDIKKYFGETKVIGWFLTRPGKSLRITEKITKLHVDNFPGEGKTLFVADPLDDEEAFYIYRNGELVRQEGYYIYYERNEAMQNYMVEAGHEKTPLEAAVNTVNAAREKLEQHRQEIPAKKLFKMTPAAVRKMTRYASVAVFLLVVAAGAAVVHRENEKIKQTTDFEAESGLPVGVLGGDLGTISDLKEKDGEASESEGKTQADDVAESDGAVKNGDGAESGSAAESVGGQTAGDGETASESEAGEIFGNSASKTDEDTLPVMQPTAIAGTSYTIAGGDTLAAISRRFYNTLAYVSEICRINGIEDADKIYPGMTITLP